MNLKLLWRLIRLWNIVSAFFKRRDEFTGEVGDPDESNMQKVHNARRKFKLPFGRTAKRVPKTAEPPETLSGGN